MSEEHPWIDFDGDGHGDSYDTVQDDHGHYHAHGSITIAPPRLKPRSSTTFPLESTMSVPRVCSQGTEGRCAGSASPKIEALHVAKTARKITMNRHIESLRVHGL